MAIDIAVEIKGLEFRWHPGSATVLALDEFRVTRGERVFVAGPSGSGKSTLLSLISGVTTASSGTVWVMGQAMERLSHAKRDRFRADHIGYIFQMFNLIPCLSLIDNVVLPCRFSSRRRLRASARNGDLEHEARRLLQRLDMDDVDFDRRSVTSLSVGQQQRVAAARALMGSPDIVIADEPTSSLDAARRESFISLLFDECSAMNASLIFVSHDTSLALLFDRTLDLPEINRAGQPISAN